MSSPFLSIITINKNNQQGLVKTINSVICQRFKNFEFIVIDGGSVDESILHLKKYFKYINILISEPDNSIYDAMNKGILHANGDYCLFLNSGDWLKSDTSLEDFFSYNPQADIVAGDINFYDTEMNNLKWVVKSPVQLTAKTLFWGTLPHQATLIKRNLFYKYGFYREDLKIASDWSFFLDVLLYHKCTYQYIPVTLSYFAMDGISCNPSSQALPRIEQLKVLNETYPRFIKDFDRLKELEDSETIWLSSRSYRAYKRLCDIGFIQILVQLIRVKDFIIRKLNNKKTEKT